MTHFLTMAEALEKSAETSLAAAKLLREQYAAATQPSLFVPPACPDCKKVGAQSHTFDCPRYTCPVCDGGPGNDNTCLCPRS